jgi:LacI family transcriptional regulator
MDGPPAGAASIYLKGAREGNAMRPTIKDVARKAKVSTATVSRIVNHLDGYSEETRERVLSTISALGYRRNAVARGLVRRKVNTIGVLLPDVSSRFASELLQGIETRAHLMGHSVIVCNTSSDGERTIEYLDVLGERRVDGILFTSERVKPEYDRAFRELAIPVVLVSSISREYPLPFVKVDDEAAAHDMTRYLIDKGHRRIALITGSAKDRIAGLPRIRGFRRAMREAGLEVPEGWVVEGDFHYKSGYRAMAQLLEKAKGMTAVFATSDEMALGALSCSFSAGLRVPADLSVAGYDDTLDAEMAIPPLTTVHQPIREMGERATAILLGDEESRQSVVLPHVIVERGSVKEVVP